QQRAERDLDAAPHEREDAVALRGCEAEARDEAGAGPRDDLLLRGLDPAHRRRPVHAVDRADARRREALDEREAEQVPVLARQAREGLAERRDELVAVGSLHERELRVLP